MIPQHERYAIRAGLIPTFPEFVDYVIAKYPRGDPHWLPQIPQNNFCNLSYQYILKMENLTDELSYLLNELELPKLDLTAIGKIIFGTLFQPYFSLGLSTWKYLPKAINFL